MVIRLLLLLLIVYLLRLIHKKRYLRTDTMTSYVYVLGSQSSLSRRESQRDRLVVTGFLKQLYVIWLDCPRKIAPYKRGTGDEIVLG